MMLEGLSNSHSFLPFLMNDVLQEIAEGPHDRSVSEETLVECSSLSTDPDRRLITKRLRAPSIPPQLPTSLPPAM